MINILRWICVIPASFFGYLVCMYMGMGAYIGLESFCPEAEVVSEMCVAKYMEYVEIFVFIAFPSLAAILVVLLPTLVAPTHKRSVACLSYAIGALTAIYMGVSIKMWAILLSTLCFGGVTLMVLFKHQKLPNNTLNSDAASVAG